MGAGSDAKPRQVHSMIWPLAWRVLRDGSDLRPETMRTRRQVTASRGVRCGFSRDILFVDYSFSLSAS